MVVAGKERLLVQSKRDSYAVSVSSVAEFDYVSRITDMGRKFLFKPQNTGCFGNTQHLILYYCRFPDLAGTEPAAMGSVCGGRSCYFNMV